MPLLKYSFAFGAFRRIFLYPVLANQLESASEAYAEFTVGTVRVSACYWFSTDETWFCQALIAHVPFTLLPEGRSAWLRIVCRNYSWATG